MRIELNTSELLFDIRNKSHLEVASIENPDARYNAEAGTEKDEEIRRDLIGACGQLTLAVGRYLRECNIPAVAGDNGTALPDVIVYDFTLSERRAVGKAQPLADSMHSYLVNATLGKFYSSVEQKELAQKRNTEAGADIKVVNALLYTKREPFNRRY